MIDQIATCGNDRMVRVYSTGEGKLIRELRGHAHHVHSVAFHADGRGLASGDLFGNVKHWDLTTGKCLRDLDASRLYKQYQQYDQGGVRCMTFDAECRTLHYRARSTPTVRLVASRYSAAARCTSSGVTAA